MAKHTLLQVPTSGSKRTMFSARLKEEVLNKLWALKVKSGKSRANIIERLIDQAYKQLIGQILPKPRPKAKKHR